MDIQSLRQELGLSLGAFAAQLGLKSRGQASSLESGARKPSIRVALEIERLAGGRIKAADLNPDIALIERFREEAANDISSQSEAA
ncbi:helix-turn-helix domain-containing protein [Brevundimonas sp.]|uniref:helix-turn-helix domain-containing protein n=1 Tax=Brevundimonas sp. TaxID=1871086 RepID=UPI003917E83E